MFKKSIFRKITFAFVGAFIIPTVAIAQIKMVLMNMLVLEWNFINLKIYIILISSDGLSGECTLADFNTEQAIIK